MSRRKIFLLSTILLLLIFSGICLAQTEKSVIPYYLILKTDTLFYETDEVVVTGTRASKKIIDIPYSVTRLSNVNYKYDRKIAIDDVLKDVPGLFLQSRYGNHDVRISIRGFGSRSNSGIRGVRILLDGIPESEPDGQTRIEAIDFNAVNSIEIVKGNSSSLYTNAPGGVVNFINSSYFPNTYLKSFNEFGSFGLRRNGFKIGIRTPEYGLLTTYSYYNYKGYRDHSEDYWQILNSVFETIPNDYSKVEILGYFVSGLIRLPGSLTKSEFDMNPLQAAKTEVDYDYRRVTKKGRLGLRFNTFFGESNNNEVEVTAYGTIKYFERTTKSYRIINRYGLGGSLKYVNKSEIVGRLNEFSFGGDFLYQTGPIEEYKNINGKKGDVMIAMNDETIGNTGFFLSNSFEILHNRVYLLLTGRYDKVVLDNKNQILEAQNDVRGFEAFTPKVALNYKLTQSVAIYTSYGYSFDSPAANELDNFPTSSSPGKLLNPDLQPQKSKNFELGIKGHLIFSDATFFGNLLFEATFFNSAISDEIVPFEVFGSVYYRNSAKTNRTGLEIGCDVEIVRGLKFKTAYTLSNFEYDNYIAQTIELDSVGNLVTREKNYSGNIVPSVPKHNLNTTLSYEYKVIENITSFIKGSYQHVSGMFVNDANSEKSSDYNIVNALFGADVVLGKLNISLSAGVKNVFDLSYVGFININSTNKRFYEAGGPRNYFGSIHFGYIF